MTPFERFKNTNSEGNLWVYLLTLGRDETVRDADVDQRVFEKFGFLPNDLLIKSVLYRLRKGGYITGDRFQGKRAYQTTDKGKQELKKMNDFLEGMLQKI